MRELVTYATIKALTPIEGADKIEMATMNENFWKVVVMKDLHKVGDKVVYCEIDSLFPIREEFEFLRKMCYKKVSDEVEGFRLKTVKMRGQISQGLILPLSMLLSFPPKGENLQERLGVTLYEKPIAENMIGKIKGPRPAAVTSTELPRIQNEISFIEKYKGQEFIETEKLNGESSSFAINNGTFFVCQKDVELFEDAELPIARIAREMHLKEKLLSLNKNVAIQGEFIRAKKIYGLEMPAVFFFTLFDLDTYSKKSFEELDALCGLVWKTVPVINRSYILPDNIDELLAEADGYSLLNPKVKREGIVLTLKSDPNVMIKIISNEELAKEKD